MSDIGRWPSHLRPAATASSGRRPENTWRAAASCWEDSSVQTIEETFPAFGLSVRCGRLELAGTRPEHVPALAETAIDGVYDGENPFIVDWPSFPNQHLNQWQHVWGTWAAFRPEAWTLKLTVLLDGRPIGCQDVFNKQDFLASRTLETGSWIGLAHQGQGIGTLMRQMVAVLCFDHLGAEILESAYHHDNSRSAGVSRRVGYQPNGMHRLANGDGTFRTEQYVWLRPEWLVRPDEPVVVEGVEAFRRFIGLDPVSSDS
ncbi:GNAT family N-acetyltransferase [Luteococcus sediminum]